MSTVLDLSRARAAFPGLSDSYVYADNAGGSQCLGSVASRLTDYLLHTNVQLESTYTVSATSTKRVQQGREAAREMVNARSVDEVGFGSSSTLVAENIARAMEWDVQEGEELIVAGEHEANIGPWRRLAQRKGLVMKMWFATPCADSSNNPYAVSLKIETLLPLISAKTRLVAFTACSNVLGTVLPVKEITRLIKEKAKEVGARKVETSVDCVAYAAHRRIDVQDWDVDYCFFSVYKVFGPHVSILYAKTESIKNSLSPLTHHFLKHTTSMKLQPGGSGYELVYSTTAIPEYLRTLSPAGTLEAGYEAIAQHERTLTEPLLAYLRSKASRGVRIIGDEYPGELRVPTVSFAVVGPRPLSSREIVDVFDADGTIGMRYGHFYSWSLINSLQPKLDSVVRISLVHYNTLREVERIIEVLEKALA